MAKSVTVLGKSFPSYSTVFRVLGCPPRSQTYIKEHHGSMDNFVRRYFQGKSDEDIIQYLEKQAAKDEGAPKCRISGYSRVDVKKVVDANAALNILRDALKTYEYSKEAYDFDVNEMVSDLLNKDFRETLKNILQYSTY